MSTQTLSGHDFPTPCKRCGGALYRQVDYCPYCGAVHPLEAGPHKRIVMPGNDASASGEPVPLDGVAHAAHAVQSNAATRASGFVLPDAPIPPLKRPPRTPGDRRGPSTRMVLTAIAAVVVVGLAYVGYALFGSTASLQTGNAGQSVANEPAAKSSAGTIAAYAAASSSVNASIDTSINTSTSPATSPPVNIATATPSPVSVKPAPAPPYRDASQAVQAARTALRGHDLSAAQNALSAAHTLQANNADVQGLQNELMPQVARRDVALQAAQACAAQQQWTCVRQHATDALMLDTGSATASSLLEHAIREAGWAPLGARGTTTGQSASSLLQAPAAQAQLPPLPSDISPDRETANRTATPRASGDPSRGVDARARAIREAAWRRESAKRTAMLTKSIVDEAPDTAPGAVTMKPVTTPGDTTAPPPATAANAITNANVLPNANAESTESTGGIDTPEKPDSNTQPDSAASSP